MKALLDTLTPRAVKAFLDSLSPKVKASAWTGLILTVLAAALTGITPDMLSFLGPWAGVVFLVVGALGQAVAGYQKTDPARVTGLEVEALTAALPPEPEAWPDTVPATGAHAAEPVLTVDEPGKHVAL